MVDRTEIHKAVDGLSERSLAELDTFIAYLYYKEKEQQGSPWSKELYDVFAPVREAAAHMSENEINQAIDDAIAEVRHERNAIQRDSNTRKRPIAESD